ncbi:MAG: DUF58 domain-containing protein [Zestosphaera sp.]
MSLPSISVKGTERLTGLLFLAAILISLWVFFKYETLFAGLGLISLSLTLRLYAVMSTNAIQKSLVSVEKTTYVSGESAIIEYVIKNTTNVPITFLEFTLLHSPYLKSLSGVSGVTYVPPKGTVKIPFVFEWRVGKHVVGPLKGVVRDPLGLFRSSELFLSQPTYVEVIPKPSELALRRMFVASKVAALSRTKRIGLGVEFYGVREYIPGDELRRVSWRHVSLWGKPFVKITEEESSLNIVFVVSLGSDAFVGIYGRTPFEHISNIVASVARYLARRNDLMSVHVFLGKNHIHTYPARGSKAYQLILKTFSEILFNPEDSGSPLTTQSPKEIISYVYPHLPRDRSIILLLATSKFLANYVDQLLEVVSFISSRGHITYILTPLTLSYEVKGLPEWGKALYRLRVFESLRSELGSVKRIRDAGIPVIAMGPENLATEVVMRLEALRS